MEIDVSVVKKNNFISTRNIYIDKRFIGSIIGINKKYTIYPKINSESITIVGDEKEAIQSLIKIHTS